MSIIINFFDDLFSLMFKQIHQGRQFMVKVWKTLHRNVTAPSKKLDKAENLPSMMANDFLHNGLGR